MKTENFVYCLNVTDYIEKKQKNDCKLCAFSRYFTLIKKKHDGNMLFNWENTFTLHRQSKYKTDTVTMSYTFYKVREEFCIVSALTYTSCLYDNNCYTTF